MFLHTLNRGGSINSSSIPAKTLTSQSAECCWVHTAQGEWSPPPHPSPRLNWTQSQWSEKIHFKSSEGKAVFYRLIITSFFHTFNTFICTDWKASERERALTKVSIIEQWKFNIHEGLFDCLLFAFPYNRLSRNG